MNQDTKRKAVEQAAAFGVEESVAQPIVDAFERLGHRIGREFDPSKWTKTVWFAEADRWRRSPNAETHFTLLLHLHGLREQFEEKVRSNKRSWAPGVVGERLTLR